MIKWSIRKAAIAGLIIGVIGLLADIISQTSPLLPKQIFQGVIEMLTPAVLFAAIALVQNRFTKNLNDIVETPSSVAVIDQGHGLGDARSNISRNEHKENYTTAEAGPYKLVERLIDESDAVPCLTAVMIADEAMLLADPNGETEALIRAAAHARFQQIAAEILNRRFGGKGAT
jgi:hypothetical protein